KATTLPEISISEENLEALLRSGPRPVVVPDELFALDPEPLETPQPDVAAVPAEPALETEQSPVETTLALLADSAAIAEETATKPAPIAPDPVTPELVAPEPVAAKPITPAPAITPAAKPRAVAQEIVAPKPPTPAPPPQENLAPKPPVPAPAPPAPVPVDT